MHTLWRGDVLIGRIHPEFPSDNEHAVFGMLDPSTAFVPQALSQHTMTGLPGKLVFEHTDEPSAPSVGAVHHMSSTPPRPLAEAVRDSVPAERQLVLRDATNAPLATHTIAIMAKPRAGASTQRLCDDAGVAYSGWCVLAGLADPGDDAIRRR